MARSLEAILAEYAESHRHPTNIQIHNICVPLIMWSLLGILQSIPLVMGINLAHVLVVVGIIYYIGFGNMKLTLMMSGIVIVMYASLSFIPFLLPVSVAVFVLSWLGQFYGHKVEGKKPSFFKDLQFLLVGPIWVLSKMNPTLFGVSK